LRGFHDRTKLSPQSQTLAEWHGSYVSNHKLRIAHVAQDAAVCNARFEFSTRLWNPAIGTFPELSPFGSDIAAKPAPETLGSSILQEDVKPMAESMSDYCRGKARRGKAGRQGDMSLRAALWGAVAMAAALLLPLRAGAQTTISPYLDAHYEHDSNVFRVENSAANVAAIGDPTLADNDLKSVVGVDGTYLWSQQKLTATLEGRRFDYDHFTELDHNEYLAHVALDWKLTSLFDGILDARQEQYMAPFTLGNSSQLSIDVDRKIDGKGNVNVTPEWRLETEVYSHDLKAPLEGFPDFDEREIGTHLALLNKSVTNLSYGIALDHISGRYENAPDVGTYNQIGAELTADYTVSALSKLNAALGYTKRDQNDNIPSISGVTGAFGYTRQLTGKTSISVNVTRAINSYVAAGGSEVDTGGTVSATWQATYRVSVSVMGGYVHSSFVGQTIPGTVVPGAVANGRDDNSPVGQLHVNYQALRRLKLHAYATKQSRSSTIDIYNYNDTIVGIEAKLSWQ
jgi:hypothetical protein